MFSPKEIKTTRFKACLELNEVNKKLADLQTRAENMHEAAKEINSLSYRKFRILDGLITEINSLIAEFNTHTRKVKNEEERSDALQLLFNINSLIAKLTVDEIKILLKANFDI